jgi:MFS family permease
MATGAAYGFISLLAFRLLLGMGESVAYPAYSKILSRHFPEYHRGLANAVIATGLACGPAFGTFTGGMLMARYGWRPFFIVLGLASLLWLLPWFRWMPPDQVGASRLTQAGPSMPDILKKRPAWGTIGGLFTLNFLLYFMITWLPYYLVHERHFSMDKMAGTIGVSYLLMAVMAVISGWISDRWIAAGATATVARKTVMSVGQVCAGVLLVACVLAGPDLAVVLLLLSATSFGMCTSQTWAITQTLAGPRASGKWTGVQNFMGNLAGIVAPAITGFVVDRTGSFFWAFAIVGAVSLLGPLCWIVITGPLEQVLWERPAVVSMATTTADSA